MSISSPMTTGCGCRGGGSWLRVRFVLLPLSLHGVECLCIGRTHQWMLVCRFGVV